MINVQPIRVIVGFGPEQDASPGFDVSHSCHNVADVICCEIDSCYIVRDFMIGPTAVLFCEDSLGFACSKRGLIIGRVGVFRGPGFFGRLFFGLGIIISAG